MYSQPVIKLWQLFNRYGGMDTAKPFLQDYYKTYAYKQVDTAEFVRFAEQYFHIGDEVFQDWLQLKR